MFSHCNKCSIKTLKHTKFSMKLPHWHQILVIFMIYALLSRNFDVRIYALFPQIFGNWKVDSADFFTFRMYGNHTRMLLYQVGTWALSRKAVLLKAESNLDFFGLKLFCCKLLPWYATLPVWEVDMIPVMKRPKAAAIYARFYASQSWQPRE